MTINQSQDKVEEKITAKDVEEFLRRTPAFFEEHTQLLSELSVPHLAGSAVSLVERQVGVLRQQNKKVKKQLDDLLQIARDNERLSKQIYKLTLGLMGTNDLNSLFELIYKSMRRDFAADEVVIRLYAQPKDKKLDKNSQEFLQSDVQLNRLFEKVMLEARPYCGRVRPEHADFLFGDMATKILSVALLPICAKKCFGIIAIGSFDEARFQPSMGTAYLTQMSALSSKSLIQYLAPR